MDKFEVYYQFLISENEKYNLTAITERDEVYIKHFQDSIHTSKAIDFNQVKTLCDVGSGAGFPGIPLKLVYPHLQLTIIEPTAKRCRFLENLVVQLDLKDVIIINERAENAKDFRESFDVVVARAVSSLPMLLELCVPLVKEKGYFIALKGSSYQEEVDASKNAFRILSCEIDDVITYELDKGYGVRSLIKIRKEKRTSLDYPRHYSNIKKKPL